MIGSRVFQGLGSDVQALLFHVGWSIFRPHAVLAPNGFLSTRAAAPDPAIVPPH